MQNSNTLPDNLISRFSRIYRKDSEFTGDDGKAVKYSRLVMDYEVKGEKLEIELKLDKKDWTLLGLADRVESWSI